MCVLYNKKIEKNSVTIKATICNIERDHPFPNSSLLKYYSWVMVLDISETLGQWQSHGLINFVLVVIFSFFSILSAPMLFGHVHFARWVRDPHHWLITQTGQLATSTLVNVNGIFTIDSNLLSLLAELSMLPRFPESIKHGETGPWSLDT